MEKIKLRELLVVIAGLTIATPATIGIFSNINTHKIIDQRMELKDVFKDFQFKDNKGVENFLDDNNVTIIEDQILQHINAPRLNLVGLVLEQQTSNSIILKATDEAKDYQGQVTLTWNLKLFEIIGIGMNKHPDVQIRTGLKGYFYLALNTNQIKFFDYGNYAKTDLKINPEWPDYHKFIFTNSDEIVEEFTFDGRWDTSNVNNNFKDFDFTNSVTVSVTSPEIMKVKIFNSDINRWEKLQEEKTFVINQVGQMKEKRTKNLSRF
ncbi:MAG: hypothetical protein REH79_00325 [Spiroplasma sp.]|nr:hypothetical protein [Spiroplasma sp.]